MVALRFIAAREIKVLRYSFSRELVHIELEGVNL